MSEPPSTNKPWIERGSSTTLLYRLLLALCLLLLVPDVLDLLHVG